MMDGAGQREREWFHALTVPAGLWTVVRLDGRGFSRFTAEHYEKPFDRRFAEVMVDTTRMLSGEFGAPFRDLVVRAGDWRAETTIGP
ncbi:MAG TPA: tRNA(His) guanylyltransferase Thg1 family protein [Actinoplanes sp.]|nr:tRNA(His) guanylyltransferase Thg1 family protein [Actinoplanes sp.]